MTNFSRRRKTCGKRQNRFASRKNIRRVENGWTAGKRGGGALRDTIGASCVWDCRELSAESRWTPASSRAIIRSVFRWRVATWEEERPKNRKEKIEGRGNPVGRTHS